MTSRLTCVSGRPFGDSVEFGNLLQSWRLKWLPFF